MEGYEAEGAGAASLLALLDATGDGLALVRAGVVAWANRPLAALAGLEEPKELVGTRMGDLFADTGRGLPAPGAPGPVECGLARRGREPYPVRVEMLPGLDGGTGCVVRDAGPLRTLEAEVLRSGRELHRANRELASLRERLERLSADREELLTIVSHELRTPVTVIAGYTRLLLSGEVGALNERQVHFLTESQKSCQKLNAFIGNLLETAREASAVGPLEVTEAPLGPTLEGVVSLLQPLAEEHRNHVVVRIDPDTPPARFDPPRIEQVLTNLLSNALKFAPAGSAIDLTTRGVRAAERGFVEVAVEDRGPGVPAPDRSRIFEPYVRRGAQSRAGGLGLGLAICKRIVEAHGGVIHVDERPGGGSRFVFRLPAAGA